MNAPSDQLPFLAHRDGLGLMLGLLMQQGAMCSKCGHATRATSKRWAVCKKCGERVERHALPMPAASQSTSQLP
jgi:predicted amidophosphoribosyltransferase